jgi:hypothetical protein
MSFNLRRFAAASLLLLFSAASGAQAADDMIAGSDLDKIAEIAKGYGSVQPAQSDDKGLVWLELKTEGHKYFINVYPSSGKKCTGNCSLVFNICFTDDKQPTYDQMVQWIADHWSVLTWTKGDGVCLDLYMIAYGGAFSQTQIENAFDMWLKDFAEYRKNFQ